MSASLVGSEMCIRDRFGTSPESRLRLVRCPKWPKNSPELDSWPARQYPCLLYTSDAADDM
eukprot:2270673-Alexandrium_andersonii.AAC.1